MWAGGAYIGGSLAGTLTLHSIPSVMQVRGVQDRRRGDSFEETPMTLDEFDNVVATMTPKQREAMEAFGEACVTHDAGAGFNQPGEMRRCMLGALQWQDHPSKTPELMLNRARGVA